MPKPFLPPFLMAASLLFAATPGWSADPEPTPSASNPTASAADTELQRARTLIARKDWVGAVPVLQAYVQANPKNADGFNLLGFSLRNLKNYDTSLVAYQQALSIDPRHKGAHEYIGMAYVQMGQADKAREHLLALERICTQSCDEYRDLKRAIDRSGK
jgi:tetratricopeptide (TPR) repeat protein